MEVRSPFDEPKWLQKCYWKVENVVDVQRGWSVEFSRPSPPTRVKITRQVEVTGICAVRQKIKFFSTRLTPFQ